MVFSLFCRFKVYSHLTFVPISHNIIHDNGVCNKLLTHSSTKNNIHSVREMPSYLVHFSDLCVSKDFFTYRLFFQHLIFGVFMYVTDIFSKAVLLHR